MVLRATRSSLIILFAVIHVALAVWPFPTKQFTGNAFLEAGSLGLGDGRVAAFGDFNGDQFLDVVMLSSDSREVSVYIWDHQKFAFHLLSTFKHPEQILNVIPGDFTHDGTLDLLVMSRSSKSSTQDMKLYVGNRSGFDSVPLDVPSSTLAQPIPIDANGDLKIDLLGTTPGSSTNVLKLWKNVVNDSARASGPVFEVSDAPFVGQRCNIANPHSNAIIDFNGDCLADVFLTCDDGSGTLTYQIWINSKSEGFTLARSGKLPAGTQSVSFADMDRDGTIDIVILSCASVDTRSGIGNDCYIDIVYNQQKPLCSTVGSAPFTGGGGGKAGKRRNCREVEDLCSADPDFKFDFEGTSSETHQRISISSLFPTSSPKPSFLVRDTTSSPPIPLALKLGDVNLDGFPDILFVAASSSSHECTPTLAISVGCDGTSGSRLVGDGASPAKDTETGKAEKGGGAKAKDAPPDAGCTADGQGRRGFRVLQKGVGSLRRVVDARGVAFIDVDEDGTLDIMVQRSGKQGQGTVLFVQNNVFYDAFFLKAIVLNGACDNGWCTRPNSSEKYRPFGVSYSGASYKYTVLDTTGRRSAAQVGQLPQTSYHALLTPYAFFGLGRTNNYIENLFVGSTRYKNTPPTSPNSSKSPASDGPSQHFINMEGVIPNSKVVIYPPPPGSDVSASGWRRELYLRPGAWIPLVTLTVVVVTAILAVVVGVLHWNEKREDELERRRASHHINFDAL